MSVRILNMEGAAKDMRYEAGGASRQRLFGPSRSGRERNIAQLAISLNYLSKDLYKTNE